MNLLTANHNDNILCQNSASSGFLVSRRSPGLGMLVVIDSRVESYGMLVSGVLPGAKVVILESGEDGVRQVSRAIFDYPVSSLHIVCHGSPGSMQLGNTRLSLGNLAAYRAELERWGEAIGSGGILLYGCEVAAGDIGAAFVERLHELSRVGVAAAVGRVGCGELGGSWELGVKVGEVEDSLAFGEEVLVGYGGVLQEGSLFASQINSPPIAGDDSTSTSQNNPVTFPFLSNDTDPDGDTVLIDSFDSNSTNGGSVSLNNDGTFTYTPPTDFIGTDTFTYTVNDGNGGTDSATVTISVTAATPSNNPPNAGEDSATTTSNTPVTIDVLANDSDPDEDDISIISADSISANNGNITVNPDNTVTYTPADGFTGTDTFTYTIDDGNDGTDSATVTVNVNPLPSTFAFTNDLYSINENGTLAGDSIQIERSGDTSGIASVQVQLTDVIATGASTPFTDTTLGTQDFDNTPITVTFSPGQTFADVPVDINDDTAPESTEELNLNLVTDPTTGTIDDTATLQIIDNDDVSISINDVTVNENEGIAEFTISLSQPIFDDVTVNYSTGDDTAIAGQDYTAVNNTITIPETQTTATVTVSILNDDIDEQNETFNVNLSNAVNAVISDSIGVGTIIDDDEPVVPNISINDITVNETDGNAFFTVSLDRSSNQIINLNYSTSDGTAETPNDYIGTTFSTLSIPAGQTSATIAVPIVNDNEVEGNETFNVDLNSANIGNISDNQGTATITDNILQVNISGTKFNDINNNGTLEPDEPKLIDVEIFIDLNNNGLAEANEPFTRTDVNGEYRFTLPPGTYTIRDIPPAGFIQAAPALTVTIDSESTNVEGLDIANIQSIIPPAGSFIVNDPRDVGDLNPGNGIVDTELGNGVVTLRAAIEEANALEGDNTIEFAPNLSGQTITLSNGELDITSNIVINGLGANNLTISGNNASRVFNIQALPAPTDTGSIGGVIFEDLNDNGFLDLNLEVGIPGITVYLDQNNDAVLNDDELFVVTDINGNYNFSNLPDATYTVRQNLNPEQDAIFVQTVPGLGEPVFVITFGSENITGVNIGNIRRDDIILSSLPQDQTVTMFAGDDTNFVNFGNSTTPEQIINASQSTTAPPTVTINNLTIADGSVIGNEDGGGIRNIDGNLTLNNSTVRNNQGFNGGGIFNNGGVLTVNNSTLTENSTNSTGSGGGISNNGGVLTVNSSTFSSNNSSGNGGGIFSQGGVDSGLTVNNSTISGNTSIGLGGGIYINAPASDNTLTSNTIVLNTASNGGGVFRGDGATRINQSIILGNNNNNVSNGLGELDTDNLTNDFDTPIESVLDTILQNNGGLTQTHDLIPGSPAIDAALGNTFFLDQRGEARPIDGDGDGSAIADIGAVEASQVTLGSISGIKFNDLNNDGVFDPGEPPLEGFTIYVDINNNNIFDTGEPNAITDDDGSYTIDNIPPETYTVREVQQPGFSQTTIDQSVTVLANQTTPDINFGNFEQPNLGSISGVKFSDNNQNGIQELPDETGLGGFTIYLDQNNNNIFDTGELSSITNADGSYTIENIPPETYTVREVQQPGFTQTTIDQSVTVAANQDISDIDFGNFPQPQVGSISGTVFNDLNNNNFSDPTEGIGGITVFIDSNNNNNLDPNETNTLTNPNGNYNFSDLEANTYNIRVVAQANFIPESIPPVTLLPGENATNINIRNNISPGSISGITFNDINRNGSLDPGETGLGNITVFLDTNQNDTLDPNEQQTITNESGIYSFFDLLPDNYTVRTISPQPDAILTTAAEFPVPLSSGQNVNNINFGYSFPNPGTIQFSNPTFSVTENQSIATVTVIRTGGSDGVVSADINLTDGTASQGIDYNPVPETISFADDETQQTVSIPIIDDNSDENTETVNLSLANVTGGANIGQPATATLEIIDDDDDLIGPQSFTTQVLRFEEFNNFARFSSIIVNTPQGLANLGFSSNTVALVSRNISGGEGRFDVNATINNTVIAYDTGNAIRIDLRDIINQVGEIESGSILFDYASPNRSHNVTFLDEDNRQLGQQPLPQTPPGQFVNDFSIFSSQNIPIPGDTQFITIGSEATELGIDNLQLTLQTEGN